MSYALVILVKLVLMLFGAFLAVMAGCALFYEEEEESERMTLFKILAFISMFCLILAVFI